jgi:hypothetical protein
MANADDSSVSIYASARSTAAIRTRIRKARYFGRETIAIMLPSSSRHEIRPRLFEIDRVGADQQRQLAGGGGFGQAGDGAIDIDETWSHAAFGHHGIG